MQSQVVDLQVSSKLADLHCTRATSNRAKQLVPSTQQRIPSHVYGRCRKRSSWRPSLKSTCALKFSVVCTPRAIPAAAVPLAGTSVSASAANGTGAVPTRPAKAKTAAQVARRAASSLAVAAANQATAAAKPAPTRAAKSRQEQQCQDSSSGSGAAPSFSYPFLPPPPHWCLHPGPLLCWLEGRVDSPKCLASPCALSQPVLSCLDLYWVAMYGWSTLF